MQSQLLPGPLGPFMLFCFFVYRVMTDPPSLLAHPPLRQVTGKGSNASENRDENICLHVCAVRRKEHRMWHCCARQLTHFFGSPCKHTRGEAAGLKRVLRDSAGFGPQAHSAAVRAVVGSGMWNVLCMASVPESAFSCPTLLSCMRVIYFVVILQFILSFLITTLLNPFPI